MGRPLIIDTFPINNELDMLECRLETMSEVVDFFIAVEADVDHQDHPKPFHVSDNIDRFAAWADKLIVVKATGMPTLAEDADPWARELAQREYVLDGLREVDTRVGLSPDDIVLHGDVDEICRPLHVRNVRPKFPTRPGILPDGSRDLGLVTFQQRGHFFAVDWLYPDVWCGTVAGTLQQVIELGAMPFRKMRNTRNWNPAAVVDSGWHLSWLGGQEATLAKLGSFCHPEVAERTLLGLQTDRYLKEGFHLDGRRMAPVDVNDEWPAYIAERRCPAEWFRPRMPTSPADADVARLRAKDLRLAPTDHEWGVDVDRIRLVWASYTTAVSEASHAASPGTVAYLYRLCDVVQPRRILDLGSGLSSVVFRKWATERGVDCTILSVDTDAEWLGKTHAFLVDNELPTDGLTLWPLDLEPESFDLVFHDMANGELRERVAPLAAAAVKPGGCIVYDDAQHDGHLASFRSAAAANSITLYSLARWTFDVIGRWSLLGFKDREPAVQTISLADQFAQLCATQSDINEHLPRLATIAAKSQHVVELGARSGVSTVAWLHGLEQSGGRLTSVDISPAPAIGDHANWTFIQGDDTDPAVMEQVDECDVLFIDTSHHYDHTLWELRNWSPKVRAGGLIVCHDTELQRPWDPPCPPTDPDFPVKSAIETFVAENGWRFINFPECWGLGVIEVGCA